MRKRRPMRNVVLALVFAITIQFALGQGLHDGYPVVKGTSKDADYRVANRLYQGMWTITPQISPDILIIRPQSDSTRFVFYTDRDSIGWVLGVHDSVRFYVSLWDTSFALTELKVVPYELVPYGTSRRDSHFRMLYEHDAKNEYLRTLREKEQTSDVWNTRL
jgi:hypothetical protein